jgi:hypothetical protein
MLRKWLADALIKSKKVKAPPTQAAVAGVTLSQM